LNDFVIKLILYFITHGLLLGIPEISVAKDAYLNNLNTLKGLYDVYKRMHSSAKQNDVIDSACVNY